MKIIIKNKKIVLIILTVILLLILLSTYIKTTEIELNSFFDQKDKSNDKELFFKADKKILDEKIEQNKALTKNENNQKTNKNEETEIENIALIREIRDPFKVKEKQKNSIESGEETLSGLEEQKFNQNKDLILLERNIIAENMIEQVQNSEEMSQSVKEVYIKSALVDTKNESKESISSISKHSIKKIRLPFKLLGIIKNKNNSSALFLHQGQTLLKKENEKIDIFKIEKINNKNLIIKYQNEERTLHLWEENKNEN